MEETNEYDENLGKNFHIDGDKQGYYHDYSTDEESDSDSDDEEKFEAFKNAKMYA